MTTETVKVKKTFKQGEDFKVTDPGRGVVAMVLPNGGELHMRFSLKSVAAIEVEFGLASIEEVADLIGLGKASTVMKMAELCVVDSHNLPFPTVVETLEDLDLQGMKLLVTCLLVAFSYSFGTAVDEEVMNESLPKLQEQTGEEV